jgi:hypothetical protein
MVAESATIVAHNVTLVPAPGVGPPVGNLELRIDASGITQLGGTPVAAWQIPWRACRDVRTAHHDAIAIVALSFGALRYRWEIPDEGVEGGGEVVLDALVRFAGARPMVRVLRGTRRRR